MEIEIKGFFTRAGPPGKEKATSAQYKKLELDQLDDCITGKKLMEFANFDCDEKGNNALGRGVLIPFTQAFNPYLILG